MPGTQAMNEALGETSLKCEPTDARKALYIINAPPDVMSMDLIKDLSAALREMAPQAIIRSGDYPRGKGSVDVTIILSELVNSRKVMSYFSKTINYMSQIRSERGFVEEQERGLASAFQDIPSLLS
jgi:cell division GTPase FtsZ